MTEPGEVLEAVLLRLARAIDERTHVDWEAELAKHPEHATGIRALREVDRLTSAHAQVRLDAPPEHEDDLVGATLSHYRIVERVASGGMGVVYRARDERLQRDVALKVIRSDRIGTEAAREHLLAEARTACAITHPNLAAIYDVGESGERLFFAMEWVEGATLSELAERRAFLPASIVIEYGAQIASALQAAHGHGIVHRDVKGQNIRITSSGVAKLLDFGIALRDPSEDEAVPAGAELGRGGGSSVTGTLPYMAPEAIRGERPCPRSDIWSLGVTLYEAVAGRLPFQAETREGWIETILRNDPAPLPERVPAPLRRVIERCLRKDPAERYAHGGEAHAALEAIRRAAVSGRGRRHTVAIVTIATLVLAAAAWFWLAGRDHPKRSLAIWPVRNGSGSPEQQFLADGLTDQLTTTFARLSSMRILSRASSDAFAREGRPLPELAERYRLDFVLETSVARQGNQLHVTARLIDARRDRALWAQSYDRPLQEIASIDREVAGDVATQLRARGGREQETQPHAVDLGAYESYVNGRASAAARQYRRALSYYAEATRRDSSFAAVYAGIADCYAEMLYYGEVPSDDGLRRAVAAAKRALELEPNQASPHLALATIHGLGLEWSDADAELNRALGAEPSNAEAWYRRSMYWGVMGRGTEQVKAMERAVGLDPLSPRLSIELGLAYLNAGRLQDALTRFRRIAEEDPGTDARRARAYAARCLVIQGHYEEAVAEIRPPGGERHAIFEEEELAYAFAKMGRKDESRERLRLLLDANVGGLASPLSIAASYVALGDMNRAFAILTTAAEQRDLRIAWIRVDQRFDPIRNDPRYRSLLTALRLS